MCLSSSSLLSILLMALSQWTALSAFRALLREARKAAEALPQA